MMLEMSDGLALVRFARERLREELGGPKAERPTGTFMHQVHGTFVTLRWRDGRLQGCIGKLDPHGPIVDDVAHNSIAAAMHDPRAEPLTLDDVDELDVELSILSPLEPIPEQVEQEVLGAITPGEHGVVFTHRGRRSTFLPSMWSQLPDIETFMRALKRKAGYPPDFWDEDVRVFRYTVDKHVDRARRSKQQS